MLTWTFPDFYVFNWITLAFSYRIVVGYIQDYELDGVYVMHCLLLAKIQTAPQHSMFLIVTAKGEFEAGAAKF